MIRGGAPRHSLKLTSQGSSNDDLPTDGMDGMDGAIAFGPRTTGSAGIGVDQHGTGRG